MTQDADLARVITYHDRTKHDFTRSARGPGYLDWATQPDPFRRFDGARVFELPFSEADPTPPYEALYGGVISPQPLNADAIGRFLEYSLAVSATKSAGGSSWKLRCNPSSGNLHPTEGYLIIPEIAEISAQPGVYHYRADEHALEQRCTFSRETWTRLAREFPAGTIFAGLSSIHWREAWKYGERAFRYCNHDVGHAIGALRYAAAALGWRCVLLDAPGDGDIAALLGLDREADFEGAEPEHPDAILAIFTRAGETGESCALSGEAIAEIAAAAWSGAGNPLSAGHVDWPIIEDTAHATLKADTVPVAQAEAAETPSPVSRARDTGLSSARMFRQRRSAVDMDGVTGISRNEFYLILERTMPRRGRPPFDAWPYAPAIHLGLFVHRVTDLAPGLYFLVRDATDAAALRAATRREFVWAPPTGCPSSLPLYHLANGDCRGLAAQVSCTQDIAGAGAFSLGMIARVESPLRERGAWFYRRLFWEAGMLGQALYLEAEAAGLRGTGIGCYFDEPVHRVFGFSGHAFQSLYHFTVGGPVEDPRLSSLPPYGPERRARRGWV